MDHDRWALYPCPYCLALMVPFSDLPVAYFFVKDVVTFDGRNLRHRRHLRLELLISQTPNVQRMPTHRSHHLFGVSSARKLLYSDHEIFDR